VVKTLLILTITLFAACKEPINEEVTDITKMASYACALQQQRNEAQFDTSKNKALALLEKEVTDYKIFLDNKYKAKKDDLAFKEKMNAILDSTMKNCKKMSF
jgi:hypothetical protein